MSYAEDSVIGIFFNRADQYRYEPCLRYRQGGRWQDLSWRELSGRVRALGCALMDLGVKPGDRVAIFADNCWQWVLADLAVFACGAADAPIYATNSGEEAAYIINDSGAEIVFAGSEDHLVRLRAVQEKTKGVRHIISFVPVGDEKVQTIEQAVSEGKKSGREDELEKRIGAVKPQDLATLIYTSGTTGPPKGVMLTHGNFVANVFQCFATHQIDHGDTALQILPWSHSFGRTVGLYLMIHAGVSVAIAESFAAVLDNLKEIRPTLAVSVPRLFEKLYAGILSQVEQAPPLKKKIFFWSRDVAQRAVDFRVAHEELPFALRIQYMFGERLVYSKMRAALGVDRIKVFINGGGPLSVEIDRYFNGIGVNLHNGYGLTETTPVTHTNTFETHVFGSVGPALSETPTRIAEDGEILVKGPQIMKGYWKKTEETKAAFTPDGWFMTGDIGFVDDRGCLHITDRKKDIIITAGGKNIAPQNIENALVSDLLIEQVAIIGEGRKYLSALIVPNFVELANYARQQGINFDGNEDLIRKPEIVAAFDERIKESMKDFAQVEQIRRFALLSREFSIETGELTPTLKMKRKVIGENFSSDIERMYSE